MCEQGGCLALYACPACARVIVICDEEDSVFLDYKNLLASIVAEPALTLCPACGQRGIGEFVDATDTAIQSAGLTASDYE